MLSKEFHYTEEDVTTVYDALRTASAADIAFALLGKSANAPSGGRDQGAPAFAREGAPSGGHAGALALAERRAAAMMRALFQVGPDFEASGRVLLPWKPSHRAALSCMSWGSALGTRIVIPASAGPKARHRLLASLMLAMSYV